MLKGQMMQRPLLVSQLIDFAAEVYADIPIVSQTVEGGVHRYGYADARKRIAKLANALIRIGVKPGDRVATLAWNGYRHFELYYAIRASVRSATRINPRLSAEQIIYIVNHAEDKILFFDLTFAPMVEKIRAHWKPVQTYVAMTDRAHMPRAWPMPAVLRNADRA